MQFIAPKGFIVTVDDEDLCVLEETPRSWMRWRYRKTAPWVIARDEDVNGCRFRVMLHRLIAVRVIPRMAKDPTRYRVQAINKDYTDVRRENLEITFRTRGSGRLPLNRKPTGQLLHARPKPPRHDPSPLWSGGVVYRRSNNLEERRNDDHRRPYLIAAGRWVEPDEHRGAPEGGDEPGGDPLD
jgi:hypothetical protein